MQSIGLIGGLSWESTALYYQVINREISRRLGGLNSAAITIHSLNFERLAGLQKNNDWEAMGKIMGEAGRALADGGAQCVLIASNTMHRVAQTVKTESKLPLIHIADSLAEAVLKTKVRKVALLGTRMTMEEPFYADRLAQYGIECVIPTVGERAQIHQIIFGELFLGLIKPDSKRLLTDIVDRMAGEGAQGVVLGCTELPMILSANDSPIAVFDTTTLHAMAAVEFSLSSKLPIVPK
jgi:aspartate racemase